MCACISMVRVQYSSGEWLDTRWSVILRNIQSTCPIQKKWNIFHRVVHVPVHNEQLLCTCGESTINWQLHMHLTACQLVGGMLTINFAKFTASCAITLCKFTVYVYKFTQPIVIVHVLFSLQASSHKARVHRQRYKTETETHGTVCT